MSDPEGQDPPPAKQDPDSLELRARPLPAVRLRRGLIVPLAGMAGAALIAISWAALRPAGLHRAFSVPESEEPGRPAAGTLGDAPASYGDVPRLGPPLPGDLGRPILDHQRSLGEGGAVGEIDTGAATADALRSAAEAERERARSERRAALTSPLLVQLGAAGPPAATEQAQAGAAPAARPPADAIAGAPPAGAGQQQNVDFARPADSGGPAKGLLPPPSALVLSAGTSIPASLVTGLDSDLPGLVLAQVTQNVLDSPTGRTILIPQGARLIGNYDSMVAYGQRRALLVWTRLVLPDGSALELDKVAATDATGASGLSDKVDSHGWQLAKGILLSTLLGVGTQLSLGGGGGIVRAIRESAQQNLGNAGEQLTARNLDVQPTIKVRPGWPVRAILARDLVLPPWRS